MACCLVKCPAPGLEYCFKNVVGIVSVKGLDVQRYTPVLAERPEEFGHQFGFELAYLLSHRRGLVDQIRPIGKIENHRSTSFIHGHHCMSKAANTLAVAERFGQALPKADSNVFYRVVSVNFQIPFCMHLQIEKPMDCEEGQHVIEKGDTRLKVDQTLPINRKFKADLSLFGFPINPAFAHDP